jgi:two-component system CheB/CheR fusion protein
MRSLQEQLQSIQRVTDNADVLLVHADAQHRFKFVNAPYAARFGLRPDDCVGRHIWDIVGEEAFGQIAPYMEAVLQGEHVEFEVEVQYRDLGRQWMRYSYEPESDENGRVIGYFAAVLNITDRKRVEQALRETAERLEAADRRKDEFLATLAHELRNPLAPIRNALHFMQLKSSRDPELQSARDMIDRQVRHMVRLVDDLLDVSRVTLGQIRLQNEVLSLGLVLTNAIEVSRPLIDAGRHSLLLELPEESLYVEGDSTRLSQVFQNLLNNAAKYTPPGGKITVSVERDGNEALIRVRDTGVGIPPSMLSRVFEMFAQVDRARSLGQGGLGIGLALAQQLVQMHQGRIEVSSPGEGCGSEFTVHLPLHSVPVVVNAPRLASLVPSNAPLRRVLVADDNIDAAESLCLNLQVLGHETRAAFDGEEALTLAREFQPDVVFLDIGMPKLDGYEACRRLRAEPWAHGMTLVALTGWGQAEDRRRTLEAGFDYHLVKPADPTLVTKIVAEASREPWAADAVLRP